MLKTILKDFCKKSSIHKIKWLAGISRIVTDSHMIYTCVSLDIHMQQFIIRSPGYWSKISHHVKLQGSVKMV